MSDDEPREGMESEFLHPVVFTHPVIRTILEDVTYDIGLMLDDFLTSEVEALLADVEELGR